MPVLYQDSNDNYTTDKTLASGDNNLASRAITFEKPIAGGTLFITIGGSGTFNIQVKFGDGLDNYGPYHNIADKDGNVAHSPASYNFDMAIQEFWSQGIRQVMFNVYRASGSGNVPITNAVFSHVF